MLAERRLQVQFMRGKLFSCGCGLLRSAGRNRTGEV